MFAICRAKLKVLVKDALTTKAAYGPYVTPIEGDLGKRAGKKIPIIHPFCST